MIAPNKIRLFFLAVLAAVLFCLVAAGTARGGFLDSIFLPSEQLTYKSARSDRQAASFDIGKLAGQVLRISLGSLGLGNYAATTSGRAIEADLGAMAITLYENGQVVNKFNVVSKGRPNSPWETPAGRYEVLVKKSNHFSSIGKVWMPYSLQFFGNFFIHGWPYYEDGKEVARGFSGGCIRLETADAKIIYDFAKVGTPVTIINTATSTRINAVAGERAGYFFLPNGESEPKVTAAAYLVADIDTGEVVMSRNPESRLPIASLTKLVTALTDLEVINQFKTVTVSETAAAAWGDAGGLWAGEEIAVKDLVYPLLLESSNDAAEVLAEYHGRQRFINSMNAKIQSIGLTETSAVDPTGSSANNLSTARDLFKLSKYIYDNKYFIFDTTRLKEKKTAEHTWRNNNPFVRSATYFGGKNGHTAAAGDTQIALFKLPLSEFEKRRVAIIVLGSENATNDITNILDFLSKHYYYGEQQNADSDERLGGKIVDFLRLATTTPEEKKLEQIVKLAFVGDMMLDRGVLGSIERNGGGDFNYIFNNFQPKTKPDILFANLEGPISDAGEDQGSEYSFRMRPEALEAIRQAGLNVVTVANNHALDWGREAFEDSLGRLGEADITYTGGGLDLDEAIRPAIRKVGKSKIAFIGFSDVSGAWAEAAENKSGLVLATKNNVKKLVSKARDQADIVVATFHFGEEYQAEPNTRQEELAKLAIDSGATLVIGHHPHVVQRGEYYKDGYIAYSLGNFIFDQNFSVETMRGEYLLVELAGGKIKEITKKAIKINKNFQPEII